MVLNFASTWFRHILGDFIFAIAIGKYKKRALNFAIQSFWASFYLPKNLNFSNFWINWKKKNTIVLTFKQKRSSRKHFWTSSDYCKSSNGSLGVCCNIKHVNQVFSVIWIFFMDKILCVQISRGFSYLGF